MSKNSRASRKHQKKDLYKYITFLFLSSLSIAFMPLGVSISEDSKSLMYIVGATFWISLIGMVFVSLKINRNRKRSRIFNAENGNKKQLGLIHFFQNKEAKIVDIALFGAIGGFIIVRIFVSNLNVSFILFAISVFLFGMHCMLNGINYKYINYKVRGMKK